MSVFQANIDLSTLNGGIATGFKISGAAAYDATGRSVASAGDVNGDGFDDVIVGGYNVNSHGFSSGASYVVFGRAGIVDPNIDLSSLDGSTGFRLSGAAEGDFSGFSVASAGDVNGDGFADLIIGARGADPNGSYSGASYVVFGKAGGFAANIELSSLDGSTGFKLSGYSGERSGSSVASAGDVNGDGFDDLIVGAPAHSSLNGSFSGASYVVFGKATGFASNINLSSLDGSSGFRLSGGAYADGSGVSVSSAGDLNGDGFDDLIVGAPGADVNGNFSGASYVVFGQAGGFGANINLSSLNGSNGFRISGAAAAEQSGRVVASAGDVNGDGYDDLIIAGQDTFTQDNIAGASYVVFGQAGGFGANINLASLDGSNGFKMTGLAAFDFFGHTVASAGDVNGDGFDDVIVGLASANPHGSNSGASYVVFGKPGGFAANIDLSSLDGNTGFKLSGEAAGDFSGRSVASAGDVNGDGFGDLIVGAPAADPHGTSSGASYVVYGRAPDTAVTRVGSAASQTISGGYFDDTLIGLAGDDVLNGNDGNDALIGGEGGDKLNGGEGRDTLIGGESGDDLDGGAGADVMQGGVGNDAYYVDSIEDVVLEYAGEGFADGVYTTISLTLGQNVELLVAASDAGLTLTGNSLDNIIGGAGGNDALIGGDGDDTLIGRAGNDVMRGGADDDTYLVEDSGDTVTELANQGTDTVHTLVSFTLGQHVENLVGHSDGGLTLIGNGLANQITGDAGDDTLAGFGGDDTLTAGGGNDILNGGTGADAMDGGDGDDRYYVDNAGDTVTDSDGLDTVFTTVDHALDADFERLYANSDAGLVLAGNEKANTIFGRGGDDTITGGAGRDVMSGGAGGDTFVFQALSDSAVGGPRDVIRDFLAGTDTIDLAAIDADTGQASDQAFSFIGAGAFTGTAGELQAKAFGVNTLVSGDVDGDGKGDFQILLNGSVTLQATDFLL